MKLWLTQTRVSQLGGDLRGLVVVNKSTQCHQTRDAGALTLILRKCSDASGVLTQLLTGIPWSDCHLFCPAIMYRVAEEKEKVNESCAVGVAASVRKPGL